VANEATPRKQRDKPANVRLCVCYKWSALTPSRTKTKQGRQHTAWSAATIRTAGAPWRRETGHDDLSHSNSKKNQIGHNRRNGSYYYSRHHGNQGTPNLGKWQAQPRRHRSIQPWFSSRRLGDGVWAVFETERRGRHGRRREASALRGESSPRREKASFVAPSARGECRTTSRVPPMRGKGRGAARGKGALRAGKGGCVRV